MEDLYGSDLIVSQLQRLGVRYAAINPGASFRGIHGSLAETGDPELIMALSEGLAVAIAHGYAKATGEPMAAILHDLVGLQSGSMAIFNAWADQVPVMVLGGSGPADHARRRPWIDWIHGSRMQGLVVRDFVKWDDQPASLEAVPESLVRAHRIATAPPHGPTYVALDALLQEEERTRDTLPQELAASPPHSIVPPPGDLQALATMMRRAERPVILADFVGRSKSGYEALISIAETLACPVIDLGSRHNFPTGHWADHTDDRRSVLAEADLICALDVRDLRWALSETDVEHRGSRSLIAADAAIVGLGLNDLLNRGFIDRESLVTTDLMLTGDSAAALPVLAEILASGGPSGPDRRAALRDGAQARRERLLKDQAAGDELTEARLAASLWSSIRDMPWQLANGALRGWVRRTWDMQEWNCYLGTAGGAGLGYGLGASIGASLAHRDDDTLVVDLQSDGDFLYSASGLWTAAHHRLPLLVVVVNNRTYGQDRMHQTVVARARGRSLDTVPIGIDIEDPAIDFATLARSQGVDAWGPVVDPTELDAVLRRAVETVRNEQRPVLVDVVVERR